MTALVIAEHDNTSIKGATLNTVTAVLACDSDVHVLVAGANAGAAAAAAADLHHRFSRCYDRRAVCRRDRQNRSTGARYCGRAKYPAKLGDWNFRAP